jgi:hypothetical protein
MTRILIVDGTTDRHAVTVAGAIATASVPQTVSV